jgi:hypothetical protein
VRSDLKIEEGGFAVYGPKQIPKINAIRRAHSLPDVESPIIPTKGQALFTTAEEMHNEPASCSNCVFLRKDGHCSLIGPRIPIQKFTKDDVEYWPCCSMQTYGESKNLDYLASCDPDYLGLIWINAPKVGQEHGGANCGGCDGGDDCDEYFVDGSKPKWDSPTGFCRALQTTVACGDVCSFFHDDDQLDWREAVKIING